MTTTKKFLWPYELGREVGVSSATVRRLADAGAVEVIRDSKGRRRFKPEAIEILRRMLGLREATESDEANRGHTSDAA
jgi:DNA-binding transcriptional MerR regulator